MDKRQFIKEFREHMKTADKFYKAYKEPLNDLDTKTFTYVISIFISDYRDAHPDVSRDELLQNIEDAVKYMTPRVHPESSSPSFSVEDEQRFSLESTLL